MTFIKSKFRHPELPENELGFTRQYYEGVLSTLCAGCGHDSISAAIVQAAFEANIQPHKVAKLSGIGCSSKTPAYFLVNSHGFNTVHGRMPSVATGANLANRQMKYVGVSGDGDTASIGMGQFVHATRRNLDILYIVENNGCYGLTKGQDSATADRGSHSKKGEPSPYEGIDLCSLAMQMGATFVARSFSGDKRQLVPLVKAALKHEGFAFIDVISPCVTFNNNPGSTKGYEHVRDHLEVTNTIDFVPERAELTTDYAEGTTQKVTLHDGTDMFLHKAESDSDIYDKLEATNKIIEYRERGEVLTGLLYLDKSGQDLHTSLNTTETPLNTLTEKELCPGDGVLQKLNDTLR